MYADGKFVFHWAFELFCSMAGLPLPGASRLARMWCVALRIIAVICICITAAPMAFPLGPAFLDYRDGIFIPLVIVCTVIWSVVMVRLVSSPLVFDLVTCRV